LTPVAWIPNEELDLAKWVKLGGHLGAIGRAAHWWIGDWLRYGNHKFGDRYGRAARITGYDPQTLMNMAYVASRFETSERRERLSWSHHAEVAAMERNERERWLDLAESERLSVRCLREEIRRDRRLQQRNLDMEQPVLVCPACGASLEPGSAKLIEGA
jgi:hypothetical protein